MKKFLPLLFLLFVLQEGVAQVNPANPAAPQAPAVVNAATGWRSPETKEALNLYLALRHEQAYARFKEAAANGDPDAYYFMGRMHQHGELRTKPEDIDSVALREDLWQLQKARISLLGDTIKLRNPEIYYYANRDSARYYYDLALKGNSTLGHLGLAESMTLKKVADEKVFDEHMRKAAVELRDRAIDGDAFSCRIVGSMYYTGYGVWKDRELAMKYFLRAAERGDIVSYGYIGSMYMDGEGVEQDKHKAFSWFKKGAEAGEREACYSVGLYFEESLDGEPDLEKAKEWYKLAMNKGSQIGYEQLKYLGLAPETRLVIGAMDRNLHVVTRALEQNADVNTGENPFGFENDFRGRTPLMHAVYLPHLLEGYGTVYDPEKRVQTVSLLLQRGAAINHTDQDGKTALHYAMSGTRVTTETFEQEQLQLLDTLLHYGANVNMRDSLGNTPLMYAVEHNKGFGLRDVELLIQAGADVNIPNSEGKTPLMVACDKNYTNESILILISAGADAKLLDKNGFAAIDYSRRENVRNMLMAAGSPEAKVPLKQ